MGLCVLAGAAADAVSYEAGRYGQGLLTYSLLLGMKGAALREEQFIDVNTLFSYAHDLVPQLAKDIGGIQQPQLAIPKGGASFDIGQLKQQERAQIPLATPRPLMLRAKFEDEARPLDRLDLALLVNERFRAITGRGSDVTLVYVDALDASGAYRVSGRYQVDGTGVAVKVWLFKDSQEIARFNIEGLTTDLDGLADRIVEKVEEVMAQLR